MFHLVRVQLIGSTEHRLWITVSVPASPPEEVKSYLHRQDELFESNQSSFHQLP